MDSLRVEFDRDYGIDRSSGWSVVIDGIVVVEFVGLPRALWVLAWWWWGRP